MTLGPCAPGLEASSAPSNWIAGQLGPASTDARNRRSGRSPFFGGETKDDRRAGRAGNLTRQVIGAGERGCVQLQLHAIELAFRPPGGAGSYPHLSVPHREPVEADRLGLRGGKDRQAQRPVCRARDGQDRFIEIDLREANCAARQLDQREFEPRRFERQARAAPAPRRDRTRAGLEVWRRQQLDRDRSRQDDIGAAERAEPGFDLGAMRRPVDEQRRDKRGRQDHDKGDRDESQDNAHKRTIYPSPWPRATAAPRPSRDKLAQN